MDPRSIAVVSIAALGAITVMVVSLAKYWFERPRGKVDNRQLAEIAERLSALERSIDAIAVETERISEGQRFTTRLLSARVEVPADRSGS